MVLPQHEATVPDKLEKIIDSQRKAHVQLYRDLMEMVKDKSIALERYAQRLIAAEVVHIREMELMLMNSAPE